MLSRKPKCDCGSHLVYLKKTVSIEERGIAEDGWRECVPPNPELYGDRIHYRNYVVEEKEYLHCRECGAFYELVVDLASEAMLRGKIVEKPY